MARRFSPVGEETLKCMSGCTSGTKLATDSTLGVVVFEVSRQEYEGWRYRRRTVFNVYPFFAGACVLLILSVAISLVPKFAPKDVSSYGAFGFAISILLGLSWLESRNASRLNRFGVYALALAPPTKPWSLFGSERLVIPYASVAEIRQQPRRTRGRESTPGSSAPSRPQRGREDGLEALELPPDLRLRLVNGKDVKVKWGWIWSQLGRDDTRMTQAREVLSRLAIEFSARRSSSGGFSLDSR